jgi:hypothetical protein
LDELPEAFFQEVIHFRSFLGPPVFIFLHWQASPQSVSVILCGIFSARRNAGRIAKDFQIRDHLGWA